MPRVTLSAAVAAATVDEAIVTGRKITAWDSATTGFVLEARPSGSATYALRYIDPHGTQRQHRIGGYKDLTFDRARREANRLRSEVTLGQDPAGKREEKKATPLYRELVEMHLQASKGLKSYSTLEGNLKRHVIPKFGAVRVNDIHTRDVAAWLDEKREAGLSPATCEKLRVILGRGYELGKKWGIPGCENNPTVAVPRKPLNNARQRFLTAAEADRLRKATANSLNPLLAPIVGFALLTGARQGEILRAEWQHISIERRTWHIPTSKTGRERFVPLAQATIDLISTIPKVEGAKYLFPNPKNPKRHLTTIKHSWDTARRDAKLGDLRFHDLRHSCASFLASAGIDLLTIGKVLGHADYASTQRYSHLSQAHLLSAIESGSKKINIDWSRAA